MRLSNSEYKIKRQLGQKEIASQDYLWENIQKELDKNQKRKPSNIWVKYASVAAVLCIGFLSYQIFKPTNNPSENLVLESKSLISNPLIFKAEKANYVYYPQTINKKSDNNLTKQTKITERPKSKVQIDIVEQPIEDEVENLFQLAMIEIDKDEQEQQLIKEVNQLLAHAIKDTKDIEQKAILQNLEASVLLAEVESEIDLQKPQNLKDKIWEALVTNFNDLKHSIALN